MQITIKTLTGKTTTYTFEESSTVEEVKSVLMEKEGIDKDQIKLIFKGKQLTDALTLERAGVKAGETVHMVLSLRG